MDTTKLLTAPYADLTLRERVNAIQAARDAGAAEARFDRNNSGSEDPCDPRSYYDRQVSDYSDTPRAEFGPDDPRVQAYCRAWDAVKLDYICSRIAQGTQDIDLTSFTCRLGLEDGWDWDDVHHSIEDGSLTLAAVIDAIHADLS